LLTVTIESNRLRGQDLLKTLPLKNGFEVINGRATAVNCNWIMLKYIVSPIR